MPGSPSLRLSPSKSDRRQSPGRARLQPWQGPGTAALAEQPCQWARLPQALALPQQERAQALLFTRGSLSPLQR